MLAAVTLVTVTQSQITRPAGDFDSVATPDTPDLAIAIEFPGLPFTSKCPTVCVVPVVNIKECATVPKSLRFVKVLLPDIILLLGDIPLSNINS